MFMVPSGSVNARYSTIFPPTATLPQNEPVCEAPLVAALTSAAIAFSTLSAEIPISAKCSETCPV